jgi:S-adenosylmethionine hydrolase
MKSMSPIPLIALLTDFGVEDPFVGIMKGVIADIAPQAKLVDITHRIPPGDIQRAAVMLWQSVPYFPMGTIFLSVIDPGVGTSRRGIIAQTENHVFIGPDNGLFSFVLKGDSKAWELTNPQFQLPLPGTTFHGRDIFAPASAYAANGYEGSQFGQPITALARIEMPRLQIKPNQIQGEILYSDQFGNLLTSLGKFVSSDHKTYHFEPWLELGIDDFKDLIIVSDQAFLSLPNGSNLSCEDTFAEIPTGECGMLVGSSGLIEIAANRMKAADILNLLTGDHITLIY